MCTRDCREQKRGVSHSFYWECSSNPPSLYTYLTPKIYKSNIIENTGRNVLIVQLVLTQQTCVRAKRHCLSFHGPNLRSGRVFCKGHTNDSIILKETTTKKNTITPLCAAQSLFLEFSASVRVVKRFKRFRLPQCDLKRFSFSYFYIFLYERLNYPILRRRTWFLETQLCYFSISLQKLPHFTMSYKRERGEKKVETKIQFLVLFFLPPSSPQ